jgi:hypothetical protein
MRMKSNAKHDFFDFMKSIKDGMAQEYERIQKRTREDPGTAGDQAEENWASMLRSWLPANYPIVTKGRIIGQDDNISPQVDVIVLHPSYPLALRDKKVYFAGGVVAAFECKLTLRGEHLKKAINNSMIIKNLVPSREGNIYDELHQPIIYGLLAHSHTIKTVGVTPASGIQKRLHSCIEELFNTIMAESPDLIHPRFLIDVICIANTATITLTKRILIGPTAHETREEYEQRIESFPDSPIGGVVTTYIAQLETDEETYNSRGDLLGALIATLTDRLAFEDASLQSLASYFLNVGRTWGGIGITMNWLPEVLSKTTVSRVMENGYETDSFNRWGKYY